MTAINPISKTIITYSMYLSLVKVRGYLQHHHLMFLRPFSYLLIVVVIIFITRVIIFIDFTRTLHSLLRYLFLHLTLLSGHLDVFHYLQLNLAVNHPSNALYKNGIT